MNGTILVVVEDLIFLSKIEQTARLAGVHVEAVTPQHLPEQFARSGVSAVIIDLNHRSGAALDAIRAVKGTGAATSVPVVGFVSHVQTDLAAAARSAGCDQVLARSTFSAQLPQILQRLADDPGAASPGPERHRG